MSKNDPSRQCIRKQTVNDQEKNSLMSYHNSHVTVTSSKSHTQYTIRNINVHEHHPNVTNAIALKHAWPDDVM